MLFNKLSIDQSLKCYPDVYNDYIQREEEEGN